MASKTFKYLDGFACEPGIRSNTELGELEAEMKLPLSDEYAALLRHANGACGWLRGRYLIIYSSDQAILLNRGYHTNEFAPGMFAFATDGGGTLFLLDLKRGNNSPVYSCEAVDLSRHGSRAVAHSITQFLELYGLNIA